MQEELLREILSKVDGLGLRMDRLEDKMTSLENRVTHIEKTMATKDDLNDLEKRMATKEDLNDLEKRMATKDDLNDLEKRMATKEDLNDLEKRMATKEDVAEIPLIKRAVFEIRDELDCVKKTGEDTHKDVQLLKASHERLEKVQSEQQKIIELLSIKTTEHEAKLKWAK